MWNVDQARQLHSYAPSKAPSASQDVANYAAPPPSMLLLSEHREGHKLPKGGEALGTAASPAAPFALLHTTSGALVTCLEVLPPAVQFARATDHVVRAQLVDTRCGTQLAPSRRVLLLTAANNTLQLVAHASGIAQGIYAPGRHARRMLGMVMGASEPPGDDDGILPGKRR